MAARRKTRSQARVFRSPIEPGAVTLSPKTMLSLIPILLDCLGLVGNWYLTRDHLARVETMTMKHEAEIEQMKLRAGAYQQATDQQEARRTHDADLSHEREMTETGYQHERKLQQEGSPANG